MVLLKGYFLVPNDVPDIRVKEEEAPKMIRRLFESYVRDGWAPCSEIVCKKAKVPLVEDIEQGNARWLVLGYWDRKPRAVKFEIDEKHIPTLLATGRFELV